MNDSKVARDGVGISVEVSKEHMSVLKRSIKSRNLKRLFLSNSCISEKKAPRNFITKGFNRSYHTYNKKKSVPMSAFHTKVTTECLCRNTQEP
jgi:hypothetical protein